MSRPPLIQLTNVVKRYGKFVALDNVSLAVQEGEFLALLGPSGCGKTTLLRTIAGFNEVTSGDVLIEGRSVRDVPPNHRPVNTVFQNYALFPHMTVFENVAFGPRRHGQPDGLRSRVEEYLELVGMEQFIHRYPSELSGGQQQRVALARAIINQPKVLLLDEPLAALDLKLRKRMQIELKRLQEKLGITFIIVTHDQEEALVMADRIVVMSHGHIEQCGPGEEIYANPQTRFVADFIGEANLLDCTVGEKGVLRTTEKSTALPYTASGAVGGSVCLMIRPERICLGVPPGDGKGFVSARGTVRDIVYAGSATRLFVESPLARELVIAPTNGAAVNEVSVGEKVDFYWHKEDARVLSA